MSNSATKLYSIIKGQIRQKINFTAKNVNGLNICARNLHHQTEYKREQIDRYRHYFPIISMKLVDFSPRLDYVIDSCDRDETQSNIRKNQISVEIH